MLIDMHPRRCNLAVRNAAEQAMRIAMGRAMLAAWAAAFLCSGAAAQGKADTSCNCNNLESLQQEVENAQYLADFMDMLGRKLDEIERRQADLNKNNPSHPDAGVDPAIRAQHERAKMMKSPADGGLFDLPHPQVKDYTGPDYVDMPPLQCAQSSSDLEALRKGSSCKEIADIVLDHERFHRDECNAMGAIPYWTRLPSAKAAEESERYRLQHLRMREQLKRVINEGDVTIESVTNMQGSGQGFRGSWVIETGKATLEGKSSPTADSWTLKGRAMGTSKMTSATIGGKNCKLGGEFVDEIEYELLVDGFKVSAVERTRSVSGQMTVSCGDGMGMSMRPSNEIGSGEILRDVKLRAETNVEQDVAGMQFAQAIAGTGMTVSGTHKTTLMCKPR